MIPTRPSGVKNLTDNFERPSDSKKVRKQDSVLRKLDSEHLVKDKKKIFERVIENEGTTKTSNDKYLSSNKKVTRSNSKSKHENKKVKSFSKGSITQKFPPTILNNAQENSDVEKYRENIKSSIIKKYYGDEQVTCNDFNTVIDKLTNHNEVLTSTHKIDIVPDLEPHIEGNVANTNRVKQNAEQSNGFRNKNTPKQITKSSLQNDTLRSCDKHLNHEELNDMSGDCYSVEGSEYERATDTIDGLYTRFSAKLGNKITKSASKNMSTQTELYSNSYLKNEQELDHVEKQNDESAGSTWEKIEQLYAFDSSRAQTSDEFSSDETTHYWNENTDGRGKISLSSPPTYCGRSTLGNVSSSGRDYQSDPFENTFGVNLFDDDGDGYYVEVYFEDDQVQLHKVQLSFTKIRLSCADKVEVEYLEDGDEFFQNSAVFRDRRVSVPVSSMVIEELLKTEKNYLHDLEHVILNYLNYFDCHFKMSKEYIRVIFYNIQDIYDEVKRFYKDLVDCHEDVEAIARTFEDHADQFDLYVDYIVNRSKSCHYTSGRVGEIMKERMVMLKETISLESYFLAPFQRLSRYRLLLENLQKALAKENNKGEVLQRSIDIIKTKLDKANTLAAINSISNCPPNFNLKEKGNFLIKEKVNLKGKYKSVVFVFEEVIIFTVEDKKIMNTYNYKYKLEIISVTLDVQPDQPNDITLCEYAKVNGRYQNVNCFEMETETGKSKKRFVDTINSLQLKQLEICKDEKKATFDRFRNQQAFRSKRLGTQRRKQRRKVTDNVKQYVHDNKRYMGATLFQMM